MGPEAGAQHSLRSGRNHGEEIYGKQGNRLAVATVGGTKSAEAV